MTGISFQHLNAKFQAGGKFLSFQNHPEAVLAQPAFCSLGVVGTSQGVEQPVRKA
jgi:hypothetical protein